MVRYRRPPSPPSLWRKMGPRLSLVVTGVSLLPLRSALSVVVVMFRTMDPLLRVSDPL